MSVRGSTADIGRLHVHCDKAEWIEIIEDDAVTTIMGVFDNLPQYIRDKVHTS